MTFLFKLPAAYNWTNPSQGRPRIVLYRNDMKPANAQRLCEYFLEERPSPSRFSSSTTDWGFGVTVTVDQTKKNSIVVTAYSDVSTGGATSTQAERLRIVDLIQRCASHLPRLKMALTLRGLSEEGVPFWGREIQPNFQKYCYGFQSSEAIRQQIQSSQLTQNVVIPSPQIVHNCGFYGGFFMKSSDIQNFHQLDGDDFVKLQFSGGMVKVEEHSAPVLPRSQRVSMRPDMKQSPAVTSVYRLGKTWLN